MDRICGKARQVLSLGVVYATEKQTPLKFVSIRQDFHENTGAMSVDNLEGIVTHERRASILRRKFTPPSLSHG